MVPSTAAPEAFTRAVGGLRAVRPRQEILLEEITPPRKLAPYAFAQSAAVLRGEDEVATGRLILLHDPDGHPAWQGTLRLVTYVTAEVEPEIAADPLLPGVGWSWLVDALDGNGAAYTAIGGTVTQTTSTRFGELASPSTVPTPSMHGARDSAPSPAVGDLEIRASWTPLSDELAPHLRAWCTLLGSTAGLPPPGITNLSTA